MTSKIIQRISREAGVENLVDLLATSLPGSDLQSLLLEVYRRRAQSRTPGELMTEHSRNRFAAQGQLDPRALIEFDRERSSGRNYYEQVCFKIFATDDTGSEIELGDGGLVPWTQRLLSNRRKRLVISGLGAERACGIFGRSLYGTNASA